MKCKWPLNHISISTTGKIRPCCAWREQPDQPNFAHSSIEEYSNSEFFKNLISDMKSGNFGMGCGDCIEDEKLGHQGMLYYGNRKYTQTETFLPQDAEIKFGNLCNAGCIMCSGYNSSLLESENKKYSELSNFRSFNAHERTAWYEDEEKFNDLAKTASKLEKIRFTGGEPTVRGLLTKFLREVARHNTDIKIQITTNGNSIGQDLINILKEFKHAEFNISVDGYGEANDFIRWPVKWSNINRSIDLIKTLPDYSIIAETSLQVCSLSSLEDLIQWAADKEIRWNFNTVYAPEHLQPCIASDQIKDKVMNIPGLDIEKYLRFNSTTHDIQDLREKCVRYLDTLDQIRGTNWRNVISI